MASGLVKSGPLDPEVYLYWLTVDGVKMCDPNNTYTGQANMPPFSMLWVHGDGPNFYDAKNVPHGTVAWQYYHSEVTNGERKIFGIYTLLDMIQRKNTRCFTW